MAWYIANLNRLHKYRMLCNIEFFLQESNIIFNSCAVYNIILWTLAILCLVGRILYYIGCLTFSFYVPNLCTAIGNIFLVFTTRILFQLTLLRFICFFCCVVIISMYLPKLTSYFMNWNLRKYYMVLVSLS